MPTAPEFKPLTPPLQGGFAQQGEPMQQDDAQLQGDPKPQDDAVQPLQREQDCPSPCISWCEMDQASGLCKGCWRTLDEIARWSVMEGAEKRLVCQAATHRKEKSQADF